MEWLQKIYIFILNPFCTLTNRLSEKTKNSIIFCALLLLFSQIFLYTSYEKYGIGFGYAELFIVNTILIGIAILFSTKGTLKIVKWSKGIYIPWFVFIVIVLATGAIHNITPAFIFFTCMMLFVYPCLYFVWGNRNDYHVLYKLCSSSVVIITIIYFIACIVTEPLYEGTGYCGISINPNSLGALGVGGIVAALYMMLLKTKLQLICYLSLGMSCAMVFFSASRASAIAAIFIMISFAICSFRSIKERESSIIKTVVTLSIILIVILASVSFYKYVLIEISPKAVGIKNEMSINKAKESEAQIASADENILASRFANSYGTDINSFSSGRISIWKEYINNINVIGHERGNDGLYVPRFGVEMSAHNTYLEIGYRCGIFAGLLYAYIAIYAAVYSFRFLFGKKLFDYRLSIIPMAVMAFGVLSNLERALYPVEKVHIFLFFIALAPMFMKRTKEPENIIEDDEKKLT